VPATFSGVDQALLSDPQTSGGLLVSCAPEVVAAVLAVFARHGFDAAADIGEIIGASGSGGHAKLLSII
jgi:selenide,water dikinase